MKSVYKHAAESGVPMGFYLTLMSACLLLSVRLPQISMLTLPLLIGLPFFTAWLMKRIVAQSPAYRRVSPLWLAGIYIYIFGTLICTFLSLLYVMFVEPHFVREYFEMAIAGVERGGLGGEYAASIASIRKAIDNNALPTGVQFVTSMAWATCFFGSLLSLLIAAVLSRGRRNLQQMVR